MEFQNNKYKFKGKLSSAEYFFDVIENNSDSLSEFSKLCSGKLFIICDFKNENIEKTSCIGYFTDYNHFIRYLETQTDFKKNTHILICNENGWIETHGVNGELIIMLKPEKIYFGSIDLHFFFKKQY